MAPEATAEVDTPVEAAVKITREEAVSSTLKVVTSTAAVDRDTRGASRAATQAMANMVRLLLMDSRAKVRIRARAIRGKPAGLQWD